MHTTRLTMCLVVLLGVGVLPNTIAENPTELVPNGTFSQGSGKQPKGWSKMDGITTLWDHKSGNPGKCLKLDTSVLQDEYRQARFKGHSIKGFMPTAEDAAKQQKSPQRGRPSKRTPGQ